MLASPAAMMPGARPTLLLVEDDPGLRRSLQLLFQARGYDVRAYGSGLALLADSAAMEADCLVADYRMPDCNGVEILEQLRKRSWLGSAVLITAYGSAALTERASAAGYASVMEKPFGERALGDTLDRLVRGIAPRH